MENSNDAHLYDAACVFALAAASIVADNVEQKLTEEQAKQKQQWIAEAIASLKQSIEAGWDDFDHMRADNDLMILRDLPEFEQLGQPANGEGQDE